MRFPWQKPPPPPPPPPPPLAFQLAADHPVALAFLAISVLVLLLGVLLVLYEVLSYKPSVMAKKRAKSLGHTAYSREKMPDGPIDAVIIGSGQGGLNCAAVLSQFGKRVVVFEQHEVTGGGAHCFAVDGRSRWMFDAGLHITIPWQEQVRHKSGRERASTQRAREMSAWPSCCCLALACPARRIALGRPRTRASPRARRARARAQSSSLECLACRLLDGHVW